MLQSLLSWLLLFNIIIIRAWLKLIKAIVFFLCCSHELNLASTDSALTIVKHYQPSSAKKTDGVALKVCTHAPSEVNTHTHTDSPACV